jgi:anti-sigma factor RsiW
MHQVLSAFFDVELSASKQVKISEHTEESPNCQERLESFRKIKNCLYKIEDDQCWIPEEKV